jgi:diaminopropionate ammonia-lyase
MWVRRSPRGHERFFDGTELADVRRFYEQAPATPLHHLRALAASIGIADVLVKDETARFDLPAFKILGVRYAVARLQRESARGLTDLACATAGNHGRAVARVAKERGLSAHVYLPFGTSPATIAALRADDAHVAVTTVGYDETVRIMARDAASEEWTIVSDTGWDGYTTIPRWIMTGYTELMHEAANQWDFPPDLVVVQAGVGSLAGAVAGWLSDFAPAAPWHDDAPKARSRLVIVEPDGSACVLASLRAGARQTLESCAPTSMAGLRCAEVNPLGWQALAPVADAAVTVSDADAQQAIARLGDPFGSDPVLPVGPSGGAGIAAVLSLASRPDLAPLREALGWGPGTRVFVIATEGPSTR